MLTDTVTGLAPTFSTLQATALDVSNSAVLTSGAE
jgi:hypothetical protein